MPRLSSYLCVPTLESDRMTRPFFVLLALLTLACAAQAQSRPKKSGAAGAPKSLCLFSEDFISGIPSGWDIGAPVEQQDALGNGLGTTVDAWTTGTSMQANANASFPVPDVAAGNLFAMANDDAAPCNCAMNDVTLTSSPFDLSGVQNAAVGFRAFTNGAFGGGDGVVEASNDGSTWSTLATIGAVQHTWQWFQADLSAFDGSATVSLRFRWSDNGGWAGGLAIDDVCVNARAAHDLMLRDVFLSDARTTAFDASMRTLGYTQLPLEQAGELHVKAVVLNAGTLAAFDVTCTVVVAMDGATQGTYSATVPVLGAGATDTILVNTGWTPTAAGRLTAVFNVTATSTDDDPSDNDAERHMTITASGFDNGNNAMALDDSTVTGSTDNNGNDYAVAVRYEISQPGSLAHAVGFLPGEGCFASGRIIGKLLDDQFNLITQSFEHVLTQTEIDDALTQGRSVYLSFIPPTVLDAYQDVYAVIEHESDSGAVTIALSGPATHGSALFYDGPGINWDHLLNTPIVRLYMAPPAVGIAALERTAIPLTVAPNPATDEIRFSVTDGGTWSLLDLQGGLVAQGRCSAPTTRIGVDRLAAGSYLLVVVTPEGPRTGRVVVIR